MAEVFSPGWDALPSLPERHENYQLELLILKAPTPLLVGGVGAGIGSFRVRLFVRAGRESSDLVLTVSRCGLGGDCLGGRPTSFRCSLGNHSCLKST